MMDHRSIVTDTRQGNAESFGHTHQEAQALARSIIEDALKEHPTYIATPDAAGLYSGGLRLLIQVRHVAGQEAARLFLEDMKNNDELFRDLFANEPSSQVEVIRPEVIVPPLPDGVALPAETSALACPLREEYIHYSELLSPEGYKDFHDACFWGMLSIIAARRISVNFSLPIYTPLYIALAARTSLYAKTETAKVVKVVLKAAGLDWLLGPDRTTPQKLLSDMAGTSIPRDYGRQTPEEQALFKLRLATPGQLGWINDELGKFVKGMLRPNSIMADFADLLLTFDSCPEVYRNATLARSSEPIAFPYLALIGCMTLSNIRDHAASGAEFWGDGFWARFAFLTPPPGSQIDAPFTRGHKPVPSSLLVPLRAWHDRLGSPIIELVQATNAQGEPTGEYEQRLVSQRRETCLSVSDAAYAGWCRYRSALKGMITTFPNEDLDGSYDRLPIKAIRIAALSASLQGCHQVELRHWALAQEVAERWRASLHHLYAQVNLPTRAGGPTMEEKIVEAVRHLQSKGMESVSARDVAKALHKDRKDIDPYMRALAKEGIFEEIPARKNPRYKQVGTI
jgi:hypothetical protein